LQLRIEALDVVVDEDEQAQQVANDLNAMLVIYGYVTDDVAHVNYQVAPPPQAQDSLMSLEMGESGKLERFAMRVYSDDFEEEREYRSYIVHGMDAEYVVEFIRGLVYFFEGDYDATRESFAVAERMLEQSSNAVRIQGQLLYLYWGITYHYELAYEDAISYYERAIEVQPDYARAYFQVGHCYYKLREYELAIAQLDQAIKFDDAYADAYALRALNYNLLGDTVQVFMNFSVAMELLTERINANPNDERAYALRFNLYYSAEQYTAALADADALIALNLAQPIYYLWRGGTYNWGFADTESALADYSYALELDPTFAYAYCHRGLVYTNSSLFYDLELALENFQRCLEYAGNDPWAINTATGYIAYIEELMTAPPTLVPAEAALYPPGDEVTIPSSNVMGLQVFNEPGNEWGTVATYCVADTTATVLQAVIAEDGEVWLELECVGGQGWTPEAELIAD
ncbi:MAG: tetratricopeptide repeat protein, partial [Anaerolineae bacterium]|nr:tetratricopeptide repeat protein [Anaerolineae bacterium]